MIRRWDPFLSAPKKLFSSARANVSLETIEGPNLPWTGGVLAVLAGLLTLPGGAAIGETNGLMLQLEGSGARDWAISSNVWLQVAKDASPSPFLPEGPFTAEWTGFVSVELRGDYQFRAEVAGTFVLEVNGTNALQVTDTAGRTDWSNPIRLRKGTNGMRAMLVRSAGKDAQVRLHWQGRGIHPGPIPHSALTPAVPPATLQAEQAPQLHAGRDLFLVHRCGRCHVPAAARPLPELSLDAPSFEGIGSRRRSAWLARWIADPRSTRADATMPRVFHGPSATEDARVVAAWLSTLRSADSSKPPAGNPRVGRVLFDALLCTACHVAPNQNDSTGKVSLRDVGAKFAADSLHAFLRDPQRHYAWNPMPNFSLSAEEASDLTAMLLEDAPRSSEPDPAVTPVEIARGRELVRTRGCLNCHSAPVDNLYRTQPLNELATEWNQGCLAVAKSPGEASAAPRFQFTDDQIAALSAFGRSDRRSLQRWVPADFAMRWEQRLRCGSCHGAVEGVPSIAYAGEKLRPEWVEELLAGRVPYKPRPWLQSRMPSFPAYAAGLASGFAAVHGLPPRSPIEPPLDAQAAADGRRMVSASGGFACVTCHAIGELGAIAIFEAPGIDLKRSGERLLPDYFARWIRNPQAVEPGTKMPLYFDEEGNSALTDFYGGDGPKTIHALWNYLRQGPAMPLPEP